MKKCLHILPMNKLSGAEKMALLLCKNLKEYTPIVVCGGMSLSEVFIKNKIDTYTLDFSNKNIIKTLINLSKIIKSNNIKIIHAHDNNASLRAYLVKKLYGLDVKVISHIHNCYPFLKENNLTKRIDSYFRPRYDLNITCGKLVFDFYEENADYFIKDKTKILSNAMDIEEIKDFDTLKSEEVRKKYNIPNDKTILGFIGRLDEQKGIIPFINEFAKHKEKFCDCKILLVGSGAQEKEIKDIISQLNLEEFFVLAGFQKDTYKFYPLIDIFFLPSLYEGLPMVLLEAMAFKSPIVSMNVGSIEEVINDETGILIEKGDYKRFIKALENIKNNKSKAMEYGNRASRFVSENYNIEYYEKKISNYYNKLIYDR